MMVPSQAYCLASKIRTSNSVTYQLSTMLPSINSLVLHDNRFPTKMIEDACAIIVQVAAFAAAKILHKKKSSVSSRADRIAVGRVWHSVHEVYCCLGNSYFQCAYRMSYESFWNLHTKIATRINRARLAMRRYVPKGVNSNVRLACALSYFAGGSAYDLWNLTHILVWTVCGMLLRW
jgi:hypothetical protein